MNAIDLANRWIRGVAGASVLALVLVGFAIGKACAPDVKREPILDPAVVERNAFETESLRAVAYTANWRADSLERLVRARPRPDTLAVLDTVRPPAGEDEIIIDATRTTYAWLVLYGDTVAAPLALISHTKNLTQLYLETDLALTAMTLARDAERRRADAAEQREAQALAAYHEAQAALDRADPPCSLALGIPCPSRTTAAVAGFVAALATVFALTR